MKIGLIGRGMVGDAIYRGFSDIGHIMSFYDPKYVNSKITDILESEVVFIAVPTVPDENNDCDTSVLIEVLDELKDLSYQGIICIKSTIIPGTTKKMFDRYKNDKICFSPEFLRERCAYEDFMKNNKICIVGTDNEEVFNVIKEIHLPICENFKMVSTIEAELTKYMQNVYNTYRILFANGFYEICKHNGVDYESVLESLLTRNEMDSKYMRCNEKLRGPSGPCLVKDSLAFNEYVKKLDMEIKSSIFEMIVSDMKLYPKTVIEGTRTEKEYFGKELYKKN